MLVQGPYTRPSFLRAFLVEGQRRELAESLVRPVSVVHVLPFAQPLVELRQVVGVREAAVELLSMGAVGAFDVAVEFGRARRQYEEEDVALAAGVLELGHELRTAVDLDGADRERHACDDRIQEAGRGVSRGAAMSPQDLPAGVDVAGGEVFEGEPGEERDMDSVDLDDGARAVHEIRFGLAHTVAPCELPPAVPRLDFDRLDEPALRLEVAQDAPHHRSRALPALLSKENGELVFAPTRREKTEFEDRPFQLPRPGRLPHLFWPVASVFEAANAGPHVASPPAVELIAGDTKVAAGQRRVAAVLLIPGHHRQPLPALPRRFDRPDLPVVLRNVEPEIPHTC